MTGSESSEKEIVTFLRGTRNYVQGTQMISRAAEISDGARLFKRALFTHLTTNQVRLSRAEAGAGLGSIEFTDGNGTATIWSVVETPEPAPRLDRNMDVEIRFAHALGDATAEYEIVAPADFEGVLNGIVQAVKAEHERRFPGCTDVWLTGFRNANIPTSDLDGTGAFSLRLEILRRMGRAPQYQTYWTFELVDAARMVPAIGGATSFAYKAREDSHGA